METKKIYEGPKMPEKVEKLDVKIVKDFLKNNNIDSENPKIQELIKGVVESSTNTEDSLKNLYAYLSGNSLTVERTIKYSEVKTSKKDENKDSKKLNLDKKETNKTEKENKSENKTTKTVSEKGEQTKVEKTKDGTKTIKGKGYEITDGKLSNEKTSEKISAKEKQKEILAYSWKNTDLVEVNGKKYKFEDVKKYLSDGKEGKLTDAFYKKLQELKKGEQSKFEINKDGTKTIKGKGYEITNGKLSDKKSEDKTIITKQTKVNVIEKDGVKTMTGEGIKITKDEGTIDITYEDRYYGDAPIDNNVGTETIKTSDGRGIISSDPNQVLSFRKKDLPKKDPNDYMDGGYHVKKSGNTMTVTGNGVNMSQTGSGGTICINDKCFTN